MRQDENFERRPSRVAGERHLLRPLGGFEYFMARAHRLGCGVIYFVADVTGPVTVGLVAEVWADRQEAAASSEASHTCYIRDQCACQAVEPYDGACWSRAVFRRRRCA